MVRFVYLSGVSRGFNEISAKLEMEPLAAPELRRHTHSCTEHQINLGTSGIPTGCTKSGYLVHISMYRYILVCTSM